MNNIILSDLAKLLPDNKIDWDNYFFSIALILSSRADCTRRRFGCVVVSPDKRIIGTGYNSPPYGHKSKPQEYAEKHGCNPPKGFPCCKEIGAPKDYGYSSCHAIHAENNSLLQIGVCNPYEFIDMYIAGRDGQTGELTNSQPCVECGRLINQFNVRNINCLLSGGDYITYKKDVLKITT